ncbi:MAG: Na(+)-translocating NADH-quinone reductase subunit C [Bacteriovoracales bacterium]|nr:Na(+)-translocating NADH-quinone reductase subunit C [Bacteriovoracales bacterium]
MSSSKNEGAFKTLFVAILLCVVCSVLVSTAAVRLKSLQENNKRLDIQKNILLAAGLLPKGKVAKEDIAKIFEKIETYLIDLATGEPISPPNGPEVETYDAQKAAKDPSLAHAIAPENDLAKIRTRAKLGKVYLVRTPDGGIDALILPIHGKGLWSTLYGFLALERDARTVLGIGFYQHGETPGLGGEVDNPSWKASWRGKKLTIEDERPPLKVLKGSVDPNSPEALSQIDGLSGATITARGVEYLISYWLGNDGYGKFLKTYREQLSQNEEVDNKEVDNEEANREHEEVDYEH